jgi:hypothetical protein
LPWNIVFLAVGALFWLVLTPPRKPEETLNEINLYSLGLR